MSQNGIPWTKKPNSFSLTVITARSRCSARFATYTAWASTRRRASRRPSAAAWGRLREVCGALSGIFMVVGALYGGYEVTDRAAKTRHYTMIQELAAKFRARYGTLMCHDILDLSSWPSDPEPEAHTAGVSGHPALSRLRRVCGGHFRRVPRGAQSGLTSRAFVKARMSCAGFRVLPCGRPLQMAAGKTICQPPAQPRRLFFRFQSPITGKERTLQSPKTTTKKERSS